MDAALAMTRPAAALTLSTSREAAVGVEQVQNVCHSVWLRRWLGLAFGQGIYVLLCHGHRANLSNPGHTCCFFPFALRLEGVRNEVLRREEIALYDEAHGKAE